MKKSLSLLGLVFVSALSNASELGDQLLCKNLEFQHTNAKSIVVNNPDFAKLFSSKTSGWINKEKYNSTYPSINKAGISNVDGLPVIRVALGYDERRGVDRKDINRIFTRTVVRGDLDVIKNTLEDPKKFNLNYKFNKHTYQKNRNGRYMYYAAQPYSNGLTVVSMIQTGSGTGQIHITCGVYDKSIDYLLNNDPHFLNVPQQ